MGLEDGRGVLDSAAVVGIGIQPFESGDRSVGGVARRVAAHLAGVGGDGGHVLADDEQGAARGRDEIHLAPADGDPIGGATTAPSTAFCPVGGRAPFWR